MSQINLSNALGVSQARISRWEGGHEEVPQKHRLALIDILQNSRGQIDPLIDRMIKYDPAITVMDIGAQNIIHESPMLLSAFRLHANDTNGVEHASIFDTEFKRGFSFDSPAYGLEYSRDMLRTGRPKDGVSFNTTQRMIQINLSRWEPVTIFKLLEIGPATGSDKFTVKKFLLKEHLE